MTKGRKIRKREFFKLAKNKNKIRVRKIVKKKITLRVEAKVIRKAPAKSKGHLQVVSQLKIVMKNNFSHKQKKI